MSPRVAAKAGVFATAAVFLSLQEPQNKEGRRLTTAHGVVVHATPLRAVQVLEQRPIGFDPRIRFEWEQLRGAREYVLKGRWTGARSWTMHMGEFRVTPRSASQWTARGVVFEARLPPGSHSWRLYAVMSPNDTIEVGDPSLFSFTVH